MTLASLDVMTRTETFHSTNQSMALAQARPMVIQAWLWSVCGLIALMVVVGGATRLTDSGLSITEWQPILGAIPPLTAADWLIALEKYRQIPEYQLVNKGMTLDEFKFIYWWEWAHRFLGRFIGVAFAIPLVVFWLRGQVPRPMLPWLFGLLCLGALQGFVGWYMVQSGLVDRVDVSQYRLALHLSIAFLILGLLVWCRLELAPVRPIIALKTLSHGAVAAAAIVVALVFLQVALGAFVAGTKAGLTYNTWPLMDGAFIPTGLYAAAPWWANITENITAIQFNHRMTAYGLIAVALAHAVWVALKADDGSVVVSGFVVAAAICAQAVIGIWTLLAADGSIPIGLGLAHQGWGAVVLALAVWHLHRMMRSVSGTR